MSSLVAEASGARGPHAGLVLDGQFRLDALIGSGSMAHVYRARQLVVERNVAIKILRTELLARADVLARFRREAAIAARLEHPHVAIVHATGTVPSVGGHPGGEPYLALEFLDGPSLAQLLEREGGALPLGRALHIVLALCDALGEAHARGIVHRDLKPENVILVHRGDDADFVKLVDFGLARMPGSADVQTRAGAVLGTPRYVSPEGAQGRDVGPAADCYALATLLYQCLAGRTPFDGEDALQVLLQHATASPPELTELDRARGVPEPIARVVMHNLAKDPAARAPDARALGRALVEAARVAHLEPEQIGLSSTLLGSQKTLTPVLGSAPTACPSSQRSGSPSGRSIHAKRPAERSVASPRRARVRRAAAFLLYFVVGALAALLVAHGVGLLAPPPRAEAAP
ncbi:MAG: serine/threonine-protein kinase [Pseudomonadota bacterium]